MATNATSKMLTIALGGLLIAAAPVLAQTSNPTDQTTPPAAQGDASTAPMPGGHHRGGQGMGEHRIERMTRQLKLTPDQVKEVQNIDANAREQMGAVRNETTSPADRRPKMMAIQQDAMTKVRAILTDEQKSKFDAMQSRMHEHRQRGQEPGTQTGTEPGTQTGTQTGTPPSAQ